VGNGQQPPDVLPPVRKETGGRPSSNKTLSGQMWEFGVLRFANAHQSVTPGKLLAATDPWPRTNSPFKTQPIRVAPESLLKKTALESSCGPWSNGEGGKVRMCHRPVCQFLKTMPKQLFQRSAMTARKAWRQRKKFEAIRAGLSNEKLRRTDCGQVTVKGNRRSRPRPTKAPSVPPIRQTAEKAAATRERIAAPRKAQARYARKRPDWTEDRGNMGFGKERCSQVFSTLNAFGEEPSSKSGARGR